MRIQLALNVDDLDEAVDYYSKLFGVTVNKRKPGYANFSLSEPPLKLVLFEAPGESQRLNHLGVETDEQSELDDAIGRLAASGLTDSLEEESTCCFATQNKVWSHDPGGMRWEWYRVLEDTTEFDGGEVAPDSAPDGGCCPTPETR